MKHDTNTRTRTGLFQIDCPSCLTQSFVGFTCTDQVYDDHSYGILGIVKGIYDRQPFMNCPLCNYNLNESEIRESCAELDPDAVALDDPMILSINAASNAKGHIRINNPPRRGSIRVTDDDTGNCFEQVYNV